MANSRPFFAFFMCINLFLFIYVKAKNVSREYKEKVPPTIALDIENTQVFEIRNKSLRDLVFVQAEHFTDISDEKQHYVDEELSHLVTLESKSIHILPTENRSIYDLECYCGYNSKGCFFLNDIKICDCKIGYSENGGMCQKCNCGDEFAGCSFENGKRTCRCPKGTAQNGDKCEKCNCGYYSKHCYFENNKKVCSCYDNYKENYKGECEECDCGFNSENCEFKGFSKECTCNFNYVYETSSGKCERCNCGPLAVSCRLTFDKYARCTCKPGYVAERSKWEMDEKCTLPGPSGWKIATYVESAFFGFIIIICTVHIFCKRTLSEV